MDNGLSKKTTKSFNNDIVVHERLSGKLRKATDVQIVDRIIELKKNSSTPWPVIDALIKVWSERSPAEFKGFKIHLEYTRADQIDPKFGRTKKEKGDKGMERRLILSFPLALQGMIRSVYKVEELPFDKEFYKRFARRYKMFQIPNKI